MLRSLLRPHLRPQRLLIRATHKSQWQSTTIPSPEPSSPTPNPLPPLPSSPHHNSLKTFLTYAKQTSLSLDSTVYIGTHYEYLCQSTLPRLGFSLHRVGGSFDAGIDLLGTWSLPSIPYPLRAIVQCKALKSKVKPNLVRELEGAFAGALAGWRGEEVVGVLCATREATKGVREAVRRFGRPVVWVMLEDVGEGEGRVRQVLWNERVAELGAQGVGVQNLYMPQKGKGDLVVEREVVLTWKGKVWENTTGAVATGYRQG